MTLWIFLDLSEMERIICDSKSCRPVFAFCVSVCNMDSRCLGKNKILTRNFNHMFLLLCLLYFILLFLFTAAVRSCFFLFIGIQTGWPRVAIC